MSEIKVICSGARQEKGKAKSMPSGNNIIVNSFANKVCA
jgi:hypothetical protein